MQRITDIFERSSNKKLVPFITGGDPSLEATSDIMRALVESGADIIELGMPFSDPMADGPVIQRASDRALTNGIGVEDILQMVKVFRQQDQSTPVVLMGYLNPIEKMGMSAFAQAAAESGVDGVLIVDLPLEEAVVVTEILQQHQLAAVFLVSPTTSVERMREINKLASGYLYYVSLRGVTGSHNIDLDELEQKLGQLTECTELPIMVGFGIKNQKTAQQVAPLADGIVVGSALVETIEKSILDADGYAQSSCIEQVKQFTQSLRAVI